MGNSCGQNSDGRCPMGLKRKEQPVAVSRFSRTPGKDSTPIQQMTSVKIAIAFIFGSCLERPNLNHFKPVNQEKKIKKK